MELLGCENDPVHKALEEKAKAISGVMQWPYIAVAKSLEVIPRTLVQNCGGNTIRTLTALRGIWKRLFNDRKNVNVEEQFLKAKHAETGNSCWGIDGEKGAIADMKELGIWDCFAVKVQTIKTAMEPVFITADIVFDPDRFPILAYFKPTVIRICQTSMLLLRIDDIVSGSKKAGGKEGTGSGAAPTEESKADD
eukprot:gene5874-11201_t